MNAPGPPPIIPMRSLPDPDVAVAWTIRGSFLEGRASVLRPPNADEARAMQFGPCDSSRRRGAASGRNRELPMGNAWGPVAVIVLVVGSSSSAIAQNLAWKAEGFAVNENLGQSLVFLDDLDGDQVPDLVAGAPAFPWYEPFKPYFVDKDPCWPLSTHPRVHLISGVDGRQIRRIDGPDGSAFGVSVDNAGDVDGDGFDDVLVGAPLDGDGATFVHSGSTGAKLLEIRGMGSG